MLTLPFTVTYIITYTVWKCFTHSEEIYFIIPKRIYYTYYILFPGQQWLWLEYYLVNDMLAYFANINRVMYCTPATCSTVGQWSVVDVSGVTHNPTRTYIRRFRDLSNNVHLQTQGLEGTNIMHNVFYRHFQRTSVYNVLHTNCTTSSVQNSSELV